ncbi:MAG: hypothetical protein WC781_00760 [Candidatus Pacearchaeota archaeon]|jgi:hypothetical protein
MKTRKSNKMSWRHFLVGALMPIPFIGIANSMGAKPVNINYNPKPAHVEQKDDERFKVAYNQPVLQLESIAKTNIQSENPKQETVEQKVDEKEAKILALAKIGFAEGRGEWKNDDYVRTMLSVPLYRAEKTGKSIEDVIEQPHQFTSLKDHNRKYYDNPLCDVDKHPEYQKAFDKYYQYAKNLIENKDYKKVSHYYDKKEKSKWQPNWAVGKKPIKQIKCNDGKVTFFFDLYSPKHKTKKK